MPRRRVLADSELETLFALPTTEIDLAMRWTLSPADLSVIQRRRRDHNRLGFALQLCALRFPGRLLRPGERAPGIALRYLANQLDVPPDALAVYAERFQTRYEQLDELRRTFGFVAMERVQRRDLLAWLLPVALATTRASAIAAALMDEMRQRQIIAPGPSVIERIVAAAVLLAERQVSAQLTKGLTVSKTEALEALLKTKEGTAMSALVWARQAPGAPGHRALARLVAQLSCLRAIGLEPAHAEGVHPERLRQLSRMGGRFTATQLRELLPVRRQAILVATVLDTTFGRTKRRASSTLRARRSHPTAVSTACSGSLFGVPGRQQRLAELGEQAHLVIDRSRIAQHGLFLTYKKYRAFQIERTGVIS